MHNHGPSFLSMATNRCSKKIFSRSLQGIAKASERKPCDAMRKVLWLERVCHISAKNEASCASDPILFLQTVSAVGTPQLIILVNGHAESCTDYADLMCLGLESRTGYENDCSTWAVHLYVLQRPPHTGTPMSSTSPLASSCELEEHLPHGNHSWSACRCASHNCREKSGVPLPTAKPYDR